MAVINLCKKALKGRNILTHGEALCIGEAVY